MTETIIDFLRHGACSGGEIFRGVTDDSLSREGWSQMQAAVAVKQNWQHIISSPKQRCRLFAEKLSLDLDCPFSTDECWQEIDFGVWEGRQIRDVWEEETMTLQQYYDDPGSVTPAGGESIKQARQRLQAAWEKTLVRHKGQHILIVQHGGTIRLLLTIILNMPLTGVNLLDVPYACFVRIRVSHDNDRDYPVLVTMNAQALDRSNQLQSLRRCE